MSRKNKHGDRLPPFVPLFRETLRSPAYLQLSMGARALLTALRGRWSGYVHKLRKAGIAVETISRKRVARLFKGMGGYFCRACVGNPPYESQLRNDMARIYLRAYRLRERIGGYRPCFSVRSARAGRGMVRRGIP